MRLRGVQRHMHAHRCAIPVGAEFDQGHRPDARAIALSAQGARRGSAPGRERVGDRSLVSVPFDRV